jgi:hypothetical protein
MLIVGVVALLSAAAFAIFGGRFVFLGGLFRRR